MAVGHDRRLPDIKGSKCANQLERVRDVGLVAFRRAMTAQRTLWHKQFGCHVFYSDHAPPAATPATPDRSLSSPPRKKRITRGIKRSVCQSSRRSLIGGRSTVPMNSTSRQFSALARRKK